ncbi:hypothetical protein TRFO_29087 [Tritrichomonas foetus]|uniref:NPHP4 Ig-like domain-containing protein n=1 Tax=Tritrichomonas foetus TaxID=1144522 RepID=A0A1J4K228_9EUKA|nr:hypothetical protein TRFO_29087 [Tritrichomonas foetus]|eukprot:OHT03533.1 hypothetical protein TRFO_29087 [Tritrichomonas foetus]
MIQAANQWYQSFQTNFPLPPPENSENELSGWALDIKELQNFSLSPELKATPDTATYGLKIYISIFNTSTGHFHGRTWTSPLITNVNSNFINLTCHGILQGKDSLIVVEFAFCIQYFSNETIETSLFFTVIPPPTISVEQLLPLYSGTPRILMAMPKSFANALKPRQGTLLIEFKKNDELLEGAPFIPSCTFFNKPIPGIKSFMPFSLDQVIPLTINGFVLNVQQDFQENLHEELKKIIGAKYNVAPSNVPLRIVKYSIHVGAHNTHKLVYELMKAEVTPENSWSFDGHITLPYFVKNPNFAIILQLVISVQIELDFIKSTEFIINSNTFIHEEEKNKNDNTKKDKKDKKDKKIFEIPLGFGAIPIVKETECQIKLSRESRFSPFGIRILKTETPIPSVSFYVSFTPALNQKSEVKDFPVDFKPLLADDGGALLPLDMKDAPEVPLLKEELTDKNNTNHLLFLFKFLMPRPCFAERFPLKSFRHVYIAFELWPFKPIQTKPFKFVPLQEALVFHEDGTKKDERGVLIQKDVSLKFVEHVINYFFMMRANEIQASIIDTESHVVLGHFNIPSAALLRQQRSSLQFSTYSKLNAVDGELLGSIYFSCGCYGSADHKIATLDFEHRTQMQKNLIIARPIYQTDEQFRKNVRSSYLPRFELAARYRDGKRKEVLLNDMQKRFLRSRLIYPIPGLESRFVFVSAFDPEVKTTVVVHCSDERVRFIRKLSPNEQINLEYSYHLERDESIEFNQSPNVPVSEKLHLNAQKDGTFVAKPNEEIRLLFSFFTVSEFEDNEISVSLMSEKQSLLDCFTVQVKKTISLAHENIHVATHSGGSISTTLHSLHQINAAVASTSLINATATAFGTRLSSSPLKSSLICFILCFGQDNSLLKLVRLHVEILPDEVLAINSKLKINLSKHIGNRICCKSNDARIAQFMTYGEPTILSDSNDVVVKSLAAGIARLSIYNLSNDSFAASILLKVGESKNEVGNQKCLGKSDIVIKVGEGTKRTVQYTNTQSHQKTIRLTTSHPNLIMFDPTHYDVGAKETIKLRIIFMPNQKEEYVSIHAFVQESGKPKTANEFYKLNVHYVPPEKKDRKKHSSDDDT